MLSLAKIKLIHMKLAVRALTSVAVIASSQIAVPAAVHAGVYQAICSTGSNCTVTIANGKIIMPEAIIEKENILSWSQVGAGTKGDTGMKAASFIGLGLIGLLASSNAKTHDYKFNISHIDKSGNIQISSIQFKNDTPANQMSVELIGMTGLTAGESNPTLQAKLDILKEEAAERERIANLECGRVLKAYECNWNKYLDANPAVKAWAEKFPEMAEKERLKQGAVLE